MIRVAIVCEPETTVLADSLETLLARTKGFTFSRFEYHAESGLKPTCGRFWQSRRSRSHARCF